ncbi:MAG: hypothetical protein ACW98Y_02655 [Candidatus Thorarchaeota archaeon]
MWPYEEYTPFENFLLMFAFIIPMVIVYFIIRPLMFSYMEKRNGPFEEGTDVPDDEYWDD